MDETTTDEKLLSVGETAALTRRSTATIQRGIRSGALKSIKIYNARLVPREEAERWMRMSRGRPGPRKRVAA